MLLDVNYHEKGVLKKNHHPFNIIYWVGATLFNIILCIIATQMNIINNRIISSL